MPVKKDDGIGRVVKYQAKQSYIEEVELSFQLGEKVLGMWILKVRCDDGSARGIPISKKDWDWLKDRLLTDGE